MITRSITIPDNSKVTVSCYLVDDSGDPIHVSSWMSSYPEKLGYNVLALRPNVLQDDIEVFVDPLATSGLYSVTGSSDAGPVIELQITIPVGAVSGTSVVDIGAVQSL